MTGRVDPTDDEHTLRLLKSHISEVYRRLAIYEKRLLILEGVRTPNSDDKEEWEALNSNVPPMPRLAPPAKPSDVGPLSPAEKQRRYRERQKAGAPVSGTTE